MPSLEPSGRVAIAFAQYGPYHHARAAALQAALPGRVVPVQIAGETSTYAWETGSAPLCEGLQTLRAGTSEQAKPLPVFLAARRFFQREKIRAVFLPSYAPAAEFALFLAAKSLGLYTVMMNESHAGTERAKGLAKFVKRLIVKQFDAGLVGGTPQKRHFANLGIPADRLFTGYDAIDNAYFTAASDAARAEEPAVRAKLQLPDRYFLSLGRLVEKKNLETLLRAYALFRESSAEPVDLVIVGSGPLEEELRGKAGAGVKFHGFRQISENPAFYAFAEAFILPSLWEEWGLVVNEAMACGIPVLVSNTVGSAEDLVEPGANGWTFNPGSPEELSRHLAALAADPALRARLGARSREIVANWDCANFARQALKALRL
jgi:1,2-diacylglycerol 3-alpha-glucosyltransferase